MPRFAIRFPASSCALRFSLAIVTEFSAKSAVPTERSVIWAVLTESRVARAPKPRVVLAAVASMSSRSDRPYAVMP